MFANDKEFEDEVRRIARLLWPAAEFGGALVENGRERDAVFETDEFIHILECTTSRSKRKAVEDLDKLEKLTKKLSAQHPQKFIKGWFITLEEPTADQRSVFRKVQSRLVTVSFDQFRSRLVDSKSYLSAREDYPFGSVRDPETGVSRKTLDYVPLDIIDEDSTLHSIDGICLGLLKGQRFVLLGDYGAGKSATVRELHVRLAAQFRSGKSLFFPITLNLRDHHGQTDPVEALERHARRVGFFGPSDLVRGWRARLAILLLDGFDEIATAGWTGKTMRLRDLRYRSMELIRTLLRETPEGVGALLAGRAHFFDNRNEMQGSLGLNQDFKYLSLSEFNEGQVKTYLAKMGWTTAIPSWVPSRPLLLGYLASRKLLQQTLEVEAGSGPAVGWNALLDRISEREAEIEAGIDPGTVRRLLGFLATLARNSADGLGPLSPEQITGTFTSVCGYPPDDRGMVLLQRLPGLGGHSSEVGARVFIDQDFAEAARGGMIADYIENPFGYHLQSEGWQSSLLPLVAEVTAYRCYSARFPIGKVVAALGRAHDQPKADTLCADVSLTLLYMGASYDGPDIFIKEVIIPELLLEGLSGNLSRIQFQDCIFGRLDLPVDVLTESVPRFLRCLFGIVEGRTGIRDIPLDVFVGCTFDAFENPAQTTNAILALGLPLGTKVVLTILKKLYAQRGSGRRESAFYRGLDVRAKELVPEALNMLRKHGFVSKSRQGDQVVWLPSKPSECRRRALSILAAPTGSSDPLVIESRDLSSSSGRSTSQ